jgi:hypothetical protein
MTYRFLALGLIGAVLLFCIGPYLSVPEFSTTADLYGVVHNIDDIRIIPVGAVNPYAIVNRRLDSGGTRD